MDHLFFEVKKPRFIFYYALLILFACSICFAEEKKSSGNVNNKNVFTVEDINRMNVSSVTELLEMVPGVTTVGDDDISINGSMEILVLLHHLH